MDISDKLFSFPQPAPLSSKEKALVWIAANEDGVSILDHNTMVWLPDLLQQACLCLITFGFFLLLLLLFYNTKD